MVWLKKKAEQSECLDCGGIGRGPGGEGTTCESCDGAGQVGGPGQIGNPKDSPLDQLFVNREQPRLAGADEKKDVELAREIGEKAHELEECEEDETKEAAIDSLPIEQAFGE